eukprot:scaffold1594_cov171-Ochromonas_danica.AAC.4
MVVVKAADCPAVFVSTSVLFYFLVLTNVRTGVCEEIEEEDAVVAKEKLKVDEEEMYSSREEVAANPGGTGSIGAGADKDTTDDVDDPCNGKENFS